MTGLPAGFVLQQRPYDDLDVVRMVADVQAEYAVLYGSPDESPVDPAQFAPPHGYFVVGLLDGDPVATGGWRRHDEGPDGEHAVAEIKRMYVAARARRRGLARVVLAELERSAARAGLTRLVLNTGDRQPAAIALYAQAGYAPVPGWGMYACSADAVFLGKTLDRVDG